MKKICRTCNEEFNTNIPQKVFCSKECGNIDHKNKWGFSEYPKATVGTIGALQELKVSIDLLSKGYEVFRALSPSCSCDLIAKKENKVFDIEVKSCHLMKKIPKLSKKIIEGFYKRIKVKYLALVCENTIIYYPNL